MEVTPLFPLAWSPRSVFDVLDEIKDLDDLARSLWNLGAPIQGEDPDHLALRRCDLARLGFMGVLKDLERDDEAGVAGAAGVAAELRADLRNGNKGRAAPAFARELEAFLGGVERDRPEALTSFVFAYGPSLWLMRHAVAGTVLNVLPDGQEMKATGPFEWTAGAETKLGAHLEALRVAATSRVNLEGADLWWLDAVMVRHLSGHECTERGGASWLEAARAATLPLERAPMPQGLWSDDGASGSRALRVLGHAVWEKGLGYETEQAIRRKSPAIRQQHAKAITGEDPEGFSETLHLGGQGHHNSLPEILAKWAESVGRDEINKALAWRIISNAPRKASELRQIPGEVATLHRYDTWDGFYRELHPELVEGGLWDSPPPGKFRKEARAIIQALAEIGKAQVVNDRYEKTAQALVVAEFELETATGENVSGGKRIARGGGLRITWGAWVVGQGLDGTRGMLVPILAQSLPLAKVHTKLREAYERLELVVLTELTEKREGAFDNGGRLLGVRLDPLELARKVWGDARAPSVAKVRDALEYLQDAGRFTLVDQASGKWWVHRTQAGARALLEEGAWLQREGRRRGQLGQARKRARIASSRA